MSEYWNYMKPMFDLTLGTVWEELNATGIKVRTFMSSHRQLLELFCAGDDLTAVYEAKDNVEQAAGAVQRIVRSSAVGASMFRHAFLRVSRVLFIEKVQEKLRALEHLDFQIPDVDVFKREMVQEVGQLLDSGHKRFDKWAGKVTYCGQDFNMPMEDPNDEWSYRLDAHLKTTAINSGLMPMLPYEALLFDPGSMLGIRSHAKIPEKLLAKYVDAREATKDLIGDKPLSMADMIRVVERAGKSLKALDRSFELDLTWLSQFGQSLLARRCHDDALAALPSHDKTVTMMEAELRNNCDSPDHYQISSLA